MYSIDFKMSYKFETSKSVLWLWDKTCFKVWITDIEGGNLTKLGNQAG